jgi:hypothetical protein
MCLNIHKLLWLYQEGQFEVCNNILWCILGGPETEDQQKLRFQVELEFVQCLANPNYLNCNTVFFHYLNDI